MYVLQVFNKIIDFDNGRADHPASPMDGSKVIIANMENTLTVSILMLAGIDYTSPYRE